MIPNHRFKLLVCLPFLTPVIGGGAFALLNQLELLAAEGFEIAVVYFQERAKELIPTRFPSYCLVKHVGSPRYYLEYLGLIRGVATILRKFEPDLILCNSNQPFWVCLAARALARSKAKLVTGEQNDMTRIFADAQWGWLRAYLTRTLDPHADCIIVPSPWVAKQLIHEYHIPQEKIVAIPNPIPLDRVLELSQHPVEHDWFRRHTRPIILGVGVLDYQKDHETFLRAFARVRTSMEARCVLIGDGPLRAELERMAIQLGIAQDVAFLGFESNPYRFMARADVFVLSSQYEVLGMVLPEAMACGCPIVATQCVGPEEVLRAPHGELLGLLAPVKDWKALGDAMLQVLRDPALRETFARKGVVRAQDYSAPRIAKEYATVLRQLLVVSP